MRGIGSHAPRLKAMRSPKAPVYKIWGNRRSGRAGEPAVGDSVWAIRCGRRKALTMSRIARGFPPTRPIGPTDRPRDLYESLIRTFGINGRNRRAGDGHASTCFAPVSILCRDPVFDQANFGFGTPNVEIQCDPASNESRYIKRMCRNFGAAPSR